MYVDVRSAQSLGIPLSLAPYAIRTHPLRSTLPKPTIHADANR
jgi:hypothetical protein